MKAITPEGLYENLSRDSHGNPVPVHRLVDEETMKLELAPKRTVATRAALLMHARFAHDQAALVATMAGVILQGVEDLAAAIQAAQSALSDPAG